MAAVSYMPDNDDVQCLINQGSYLSGILVNGRWHGALLVGFLERNSDDSIIGVLADWWQDPRRYEQDVEILLPARI